VAADNATVLYQMGVVATAGIVVFGLSRLTGLAEQVEATRRELARAAVERERLRVAQDTHDLLGLGLSVVALKSDLAGRLIDRDPADDYARARSELATLLRAAGQARADLRAVAVGENEVSLRAELDVEDHCGLRPRPKRRTD
jgi:signal transduction histidine kinase